MNNEEKILSMLETLVEGQKKLDTRVEKLEKGQKKLESDMGSLKEGQKKLEEGQLKLIVKVEHDHDQILKALSDAQVGYEDKQKIIETEVVQLKEITARHDIEIRALKQAR